MLDPKTIKDEEIAFADCEGNNFYPMVDKLWTLQIAMGPDVEPTVYADQEGYPSIAEGIEVLRNAKAYVFHNGMGYDLWTINKFFPNTIDRRKVLDSLIISRLMDSTAQRHSLAELGEALGYPKGDHHEFDRFTPAMARYGKRDVEILQKAWKGTNVVRSFGQFWRDYPEACNIEFQTAFVIAGQSYNGFAFDYDEAIKLEAELHAEKWTILTKLKEVFPPIVTERWSEKTGKRLKDSVEEFNPASREQIAERLISKYGWEPSVTTPSGKPKVDETILEELPYPEAQECARLLRWDKKLGMLSSGANGWLKVASRDPDGVYRIHGQINTLGARTHRMSHFKPNTAQVDKDYRMRALWTSDPDWDLVGTDAEGLELRELAHFLQPYDNGTYIDIVHSGDKKKGTDIHTVNKKAAGLYLRDSAKTMIYAHNYGCFDKKLGDIIASELRLIIQAFEAENPSKDQIKIMEEVAGHIDLKEAKAKLASIKSLAKAGAILRLKIEVGIVGLGELIAKCKSMHNRRAALPAHDKRWIPSASDHSALNTLLQGNGSVVMKQALVCAYDEFERLQLLDKVKFVANVHDEFQSTCHPDVTEKVKEVGKWAITQAGLILEVRCPLVGDSQSGKNWAETH